VESPATAPAKTPVRYLELDWRTLLVVLVVSLVFILLFRTVQQLPSSFTAIVVAAFLAFALNPLVRWVESRLKVGRGTAVGIVLLVVGSMTLVGVLLLGQKTVDQAEQMQSQLPSVLQQMTDLPFVGKTLAENDAPNKVQQWLSDLPS